jgi:hypothetical protein
MLFDRTIKTLSVPLLYAGVIAGATLAAPDPAYGTDITGRSVSVVEPAAAGFDYTRHGVATFGSGELAAGVINGKLGPVSEGREYAKIEATYRFDDGSTISMRFDGSWDLTTGSGAGDFVAGTGRFQGITGTFTYTGKLHGRIDGNPPRFPGPAEADWTGSYSVPVN